MNILFASMPFDGHFNPLTSLAVHLKGQGHDVRFYTGPSFGPKLAQIGVPHLGFVKAQDVNAQNVIEHFPEIARLKPPKLLSVTLEKIFFGNLEAHYRDILAYRAHFPFDVIVHDGAFYAARLVAEKVKVPLFTIAPAPTPTLVARGMPPPFFGLLPATNPFARLKHRFINALVESTTKSGMKIMADLRSREGLPPFHGSIFDFYAGFSNKFLQIGVPGLDYPAKHVDNFGFLGPLLPQRSSAATKLGIEDKIARYPSLVVVSQGTIDNRDPEKLFVPALEALKGGPHLVVVCTGHRHTEELRERYPEDNVVIEDYLDFGVLLDHADVFICNGGYGSILQALVKGVPLLSAGQLEGKNDINARIEYAGVGLNLRTERPTPAQIKDGVARVLSEPGFGSKAKALQAELASYDPFAIFDEALAEALPTAAKQERRAS